VGHPIAKQRLFIESIAAMIPDLPAGRT